MQQTQPHTEYTEDGLPVRSYLVTVDSEIGTRVVEIRTSFGLDSARTRAIVAFGRAAIKNAKVTNVEEVYGA